MLCIQHVKQLHLPHDSLETCGAEDFFLRLCGAELSTVSILPRRVRPQRERNVPSLEIQTNVLVLQLQRHGSPSHHRLEQMESDFSLMTGVEKKPSF